MYVQIIRGIAAAGIFAFSLPATAAPDLDCSNYTRYTSEVRSETADYTAKGDRALAAGDAEGAYEQYGNAMYTFVHGDLGGPEMYRQCIDVEVYRPAALGLQKSGSMLARQYEEDSPATAARIYFESANGGEALRLFEEQAAAILAEENRRSKPEQRLAAFEKLFDRQQRSAGALKHLPFAPPDAWEATIYTLTDYLPFIAREREKLRQKPLRERIISAAPKVIRHVLAREERLFAEFEPQDESRLEPGQSATSPSLRLLKSAHLLLGELGVDDAPVRKRAEARGDALNESGHELLATAYFRISGSYKKMRRDEMGEIMRQMMSRDAAAPQSARPRQTMSAEEVQRRKKAVLREQIQGMKKVIHTMEKQQRTQTDPQVRERTEMILEKQRQVLRKMQNQYNAL